MLTEIEQEYTRLQRRLYQAQRDRELYRMTCWLLFALLVLSIAWGVG